MKKLLIIRGLPGSGKTTLAQKWVQESENACLFEDDMFFTHNGKYLFELDKLPTAYKWCRQQTEEAMKKNKNVFVCSTSTSMERIKPYKELALKYGYSMKVYRCTADYGNIHGVTEKVLQKMRDKFEDYPGEILIDSSRNDLPLAKEVH